MAVRFVKDVESAIAAIRAAPEKWRMADPPDVRRCVLRRFPFALYYRWQPAENLVAIYAVVHTSRWPGYWRDRLPPAS